MSDHEYKKIHEREKKARKLAEKILEEKSLELYNLNIQLQKTNEDLEKNVIERTKELEEAKNTAEELAEMKTVFLSKMSHEMRTPLNAIIGYASLLEEHDIKYESKEILSKINYSGKVLLSLINNVLDHSRLEASRETLVNSHFDLEQELNELFGIFELSARNEKLDYKYEISDNCKQLVSLDLGKIKQIYINLIGNAIKFTEVGSISILVSLEENILISKIIDTGLGISKEDQTSMFEPFVQINRNESYKYKGTGLGLSITKNLINLLSGEIEVESKKGVGTKIQFSLPIEFSNKEVLSKEISKEGFTHFKSQKLKALIVEDNSMNADLLGRILDKQSILHITCVDGRKCLELLEKNRDFDFIFMDLRMPVLDGFETTTKIRELYPEFKAKVILLTAEPSIFSGNIKFEAIFDAFLNKPYQVKEILNLMHDILEK